METGRNQRPSSTAGFEKSMPDSSCLAVESFSMAGKS